MGRAVSIEVKLTEASARVLALAAHSDEGAGLMRFLAADAERLRRENDTEQDEVLLRWRQGAIQYIDELMKAAQRAPESARRFHENRRATGTWQHL